MYAVEAPDIQDEARGGLLKVANVISGADKHLIYQGVTYEVALDGHARRVPTDGSNKVFDQRTLLSGDPFSIYRGIDLSQFQRDEGEPLADKAFGAGKSYAVEQAIQELVLNPNAVDITPTAGTPVTEKRLATGLLEQYAADQYSGLPLIHANRLGTAILDPEPDPDTWISTTKQGTPFANGGGYSSTGPGGVGAPAGAAWVYITGQVNIWEGEVFIGSGDDLPNNRFLALAEATYVPTIESFVAAILVGI